MRASEALAKNIRAGRAIRGYTQQDLAKAMTRLGHEWSDTTVSQVEATRRRVSTDELVGLGLVLGYCLPDLLVPPETEKLDYGDGTMRPGFVHLWARGDVIVLLEWDAEGNRTDPRIMMRIGLQEDSDTLRTAIEMRERAGR